MFVRLCLSRCPLFRPSLLCYWWSLASLSATTLAVPIQVLKPRYILPYCKLITSLSWIITSELSGTILTAFGLTCCYDYPAYLYGLLDDMLVEATLKIQVLSGKLRRAGRLADHSSSHYSIGQGSTNEPTSGGVGGLYQNLSMAQA